MCVVCGCGKTEAGREPVEGHDHAHAHAHAHAHDHDHAHVHDHAHAHGPLHYGKGEARVTVPGLSQARVIKLEADVLGANKRIADENRRHFTAHGVLALNLVSSPGAGKTTLLCETIKALKASHAHVHLGVIEGDQQTSNDADRVRAAGAPAIQVNTGKGCHLDAQMVADAFARLPMHSGGHDHDHAHGGILLIENVGNLVCPALWDLGEWAKVAILSVTEGDDKPLKYPDMFAAARLLVLNKIDLLPYVQFDVQACIANARRVNPSIEIMEVSATKAGGVAPFVEWLLRAQSGHAGTPHAHGAEDALQRRIAELEQKLRAAGLTP
jgi:hydrogenase nickel incorporation protein HypB